MLSFSRFPSTIYSKRHQFFYYEATFSINSLQDIIFLAKFAACSEERIDLHLAMVYLYIVL